MTVIPVMTPHHLENSQEVDQQAEYKKRKKKRLNFYTAGSKRTAGSSISSKSVLLP